MDFSTFNIKLTEYPQFGIILNSNSLRFRHLHAILHNITYVTNNIPLGIGIPTVRYFFKKAHPPPFRSLTQSHNKDTKSCGNSKIKKHFFIKYFFRILYYERKIY